MSRNVIARQVPVRHYLARDRGKVESMIARSSIAATPRFIGRCLITGSEGVIGRALRAALEARGGEVVGLDLLGKGGEKGDVRDASRVRDAVDGCDGVVHFAAVSRVVWSERAPEVCWSTNVGGLRNVLEAAGERKRRPWILFASSREV